MYSYVENMPPANKYASCVKLLIYLQGTLKIIYILICSLSVVYSIKYFKHLHLYNLKHDMRRETFQVKKMKRKSTNIGCIIFNKNCLYLDMEHEGLI